MDGREIPFDPSILSIIADQRQARGQPVALGDVCPSGTYWLYRRAKMLVEGYLSGRQRQVLALFLAGRNFSEIAATLGISKDSAVQYYRRAVKTLKKVSHD